MTTNNVDLSTSHSDDQHRRQHPPRLRCAAGSGNDESRGKQRQDWQAGLLYEALRFLRLILFFLHQHSLQSLLGQQYLVL